MFDERKRKVKVNLLKERNSINIIYLSINLNDYSIVYSTIRLLINIKKYIHKFVLSQSFVVYNIEKKKNNNKPLRLLLLEIIIMMIIMMMTKEKKRKTIYIYISICIFLKQNVYAIDDETAVVERH